MAQRQQPASKTLEAFYAEALTSISEIAKRHGNEAKVLDMIAVLSVGVGRLICACYPNERDLARATAIANIDHEVATLGQGVPTPMEKQ